MNLIFLDNSGKHIPKKLFFTLFSRLHKFVTTQKTSVELLLTNDKEIQELNKTYRKKDCPTDVLSFQADPQGLLNKNVAIGHNNLGQIVISVERASAQAKELGQSLNEELQFLFTHGLLHLTGFDHQNPEEEKLMLEKAYDLLGRNKK